MPTQIKALLRRYNAHHLGTQAAALAFYLLFMLFPVLIFLSALIGLLRLDSEAILLALGTIAPEAVVELVEVYLHHVSTHSSPSLALFGLVFSIYFPTRAANTLLRSVRTAYHLGPPRSALGQLLRSLLYTVVLIATIALALLVAALSDRLVSWGVRALGLPGFLPGLWQHLRLPLAAAAGFVAVGALYVLAQDQRPRWRWIWPGTAASMVGVVVSSWGYSLYVTYFANYSALYGSIAAVMVVLMWLYLTALMLLLGAEINGIMKNDRENNEGENVV